MRLLFAVYDSKSERYMPPFACGMHGEAERSFGDVVQRVDDPQNMIAQHPEDYTLMYVGQYDDEKGVLLPNKEGPTVVGNGLQFIRKPRLAQEG